MSDLKIRPLTAADLERIANIDNSHAGLHRKPYFQRYLANTSATPENFITCGVEENGVLQGFAFVRILIGDFGTLATIAVLDGLGVAPEAKRKGVGHMIVADIEHQMKARKISILRTLAVWTDPVMTSFFHSTGFRLDSSRIIEREIVNLQLDTGEPPLARDRILIRSFRKEDLPGVVRIDAKYTGGDRYAYYAAKSREMLEESGIRMSVVSEDDGVLTGFIMARIDVGEFDRVETQGVIDTIAIHPAYAGTGVSHALLSQLLINLSSLKVESVRTLVGWENYRMQRFLSQYGFGPSQRLVLCKVVQCR